MDTPAMRNRYTQCRLLAALGALLILAQPEAGAHGVSPLITAGVTVEWADAPLELLLPSAWGEQLKSAHDAQACLGFSAETLPPDPGSMPPAAPRQRLGDKETLNPPARATFWVKAPGPSSGPACAGAAVHAWLSPREKDFPFPSLEWAPLFNQLQRKEPPLALAHMRDETLLMVPTPDFYNVTDPARWQQLGKLLTVVQASLPLGAERDALIAAILRPVGIALYQGEYPRLKKVAPIQVYDSALFHYEEGLIKARRTLANDVYALAVLRVHRASRAGASPFLDELNASVRTLMRLSDIDYLSALILDRTQTASGPSGSVGACVRRYSNSVAYASHCRHNPSLDSDPNSFEASCLDATPQDPDIYWDLGDSGERGPLSISFAIPGQAACRMVRFEFADHGAAGARIEEHVEEEEIKPSRQSGASSPPKLVAQ